ncbi:MAG: hypothetical protein ACRECA_06500, partial [Pseudolabrys sp.]
MRPGETAAQSNHKERHVGTRIMGLMQGLSASLTCIYKFEIYSLGHSRAAAGNAVIPINLISDLESAIATGSQKTGALLHRITDLFLIHAGHYSPDQLGMYDDIL